MSSLYGGQGATGNMPSPTQTGQKPWKEKLPSGMRKTLVQQYTPEQMQQHQQMFQYAAPDSYLSKLAGGDQSTFDQVEAPAFRQFNQQVGNLASRFSGMGGTGSRRSSGFQNASTQAASNFAQDLQSNRQNLQRQALTDLRGLSQELLSARPYEVGLEEKPQGFDWLGAGGALAGGVGGFFLGGPAGAAQGAQLGNSLLSRGGPIQGGRSPQGGGGGFNFGNAASMASSFMSNGNTGGGSGSNYFGDASNRATLNAAKNFKY